MDLSLNGKAMMKNFLFDVAGLTGNFTLQGREEQCIQYTRETVGNNKVLVSHLEIARERVAHFCWSSVAVQWRC